MKCAEVTRPRGTSTFSYTPPFWIGRLLDGSLNTTLAQLLAAPGVVHRAPSAPEDGHQVKLIVGPGVPREFCSRWFGKRGLGTAIFADRHAVLPREWSTLLPFAPGAKDSDDEPNPSTTYIRKILTLNDVREVPNANGGTLPFPHHIVYDGAAEITEWRVQEVEFNRPLSASIFELPKSEDIAVSTDEKIARRPAASPKDGPRAAERRALNAEADRLLASAPPRARAQSSSSWAWYVASGVCAIGLAWGVQRVRKGG